MGKVKNISVAKAGLFVLLVIAIIIVDYFMDRNKPNNGI